MAKGLKYLLPILLLVLGCDIGSIIRGIGLSNFVPENHYSCKLMTDDLRAVWAYDCETGDECGEDRGDWFTSSKTSTEIETHCPVPGGLGVLVCELDTLIYYLFEEPKYDHTLNICSCSCDLDD